MACLDMFNNEQHQGLYAPMSPRISFSNDFVDTQRIIKQHNENRSSSASSSAAAAASSDFEFSVSNYSMMAADELFSKGRLLPYKDNPNTTCTNKMFQKMTLRDELLNNTDHHQTSAAAAAPRPPKAGGSIRWKELLGLKRNRTTVSKKGNANKADGSSSSIGSSKLGQESTLQEVESTEGGGSTSCRDEDENGNII